MKHQGPRSPDLDPRVWAKLHAYLDLLRERAVPAGMIAKSDLDRLDDRHIQDPLRALPHLSGSEHVVDLGSGAGIPGLPLAICLPATGFVLAEPRRLRAAFLELAVEHLELDNVVVHAGPAQSLPPGFDTAIARAFGDARSTWEVAKPLLMPGGRLFYWAGARFSMDDLPDEVVVELVPPTSSLAHSGPVVIMSLT